MLTFVDVELATRIMIAPQERCRKNSRIPGGTRLLCDDVYPIIQGGRSCGDGPIVWFQLLFFSKIKPKEEKVVFNSPCCLLWFSKV